MAGRNTPEFGDLLTEDSALLRHKLDACHKHERVLKIPGTGLSFGRLRSPVQALWGVGVVLRFFGSHEAGSDADAVKEKPLVPLLLRPIILKDSDIPNMTCPN